MDILQRRQKRWQGCWGTNHLAQRHRRCRHRCLLWHRGIRRRQHQLLDSIANQHGLSGTNPTYRSIRHCRHQNPLLHLRNRQNRDR